MGRDDTPGPNPLEQEWFDAAKKGDLPRLQQVFARGVEINAVDPHRRTALFYAITPYGGHEAMVRWLVQQGIDLNVRDRAGESALQFGQGAVTSALENNIVGHARTLFLRHGYRESAREQALRPRPAGPPPRRKLSDYWGRWTIDSVEHRGIKVHLSGKRVRSDLQELELEVGEYALNDAGNLVLRGTDDAGEVTVELRGQRVALLRRSAGPAGLRLELRIKR